MKTGNSRKTFCLCLEEDEEHNNLPKLRGSGVSETKRLKAICAFEAFRSFSAILDTTSTHLLVIRSVMRGTSSLGAANWHHGESPRRTGPQGRSFRPEKGWVRIQVQCSVEHTALPHRISETWTLQKEAMSSEPLNQTQDCHPVIFADCVK